MRIIPTLAFAGLCASTAQAQPTLTQATNAPVAGTSFSFNYGPYLQPGPAGSMQNWNLSALAADSIVDVHLVAASATPNGAQFPTADVAEVNEVVTTYYDVTGNGVYFAGSDDGSTVIPFTTMGKFLPYPCTFGSSWSSPQAATFTSDDLEVVRTGSATGEADGYGTLTMPWGTVPNVLRVHWVSEVQDSTALFTMNSTYDAYLFYTTGQSYPIAELVSATFTFLGNSQTEQFSRWTGPLSTDVRADMAAGSVVTVYPNPATDVLLVELPQQFQGAVNGAVHDALGSVVRTVLFYGAGTRATLPLEGLAEGAYVLVLTDAQGSRATARFAKH